MPSLARRTLGDDEIVIGLLFTGQSVIDYVGFDSPQKIKRESKGLVVGCCAVRKGAKRNATRVCTEPLLYVFDGH